jgi:hypothetical protein
MDEITRAEFEKVHARISDMKERVVTLEAQQPHINSALLRIEGSVGKLADKIGKAIWVAVPIILTPFVALMFKAFAGGALARFL